MKLFAFSLISLIAFSQISYPETDALQAVADARLHAEQDVSEPLWALSGTFCCVFGVAFAYIEQPQVPMHRFMGKSPEYISIYTDEYNRTAKRKQIGAAVVGCIFSAAIITFWSLANSTNSR